MAHEAVVSLPGRVNPRVAAVFDGYPETISQHLLRLRRLIFETAAATEGVGEISETLKWGEPAYLTEQTKSGSTIRLGWKPEHPDEYAMYFTCSTNLVETFAERFPNLRCQGNRAILFRLEEEAATDALRTCIRLALTYHLQQKPRRRVRRRRRAGGASGRTSS